MHSPFQIGSVVLSAFLAMGCRDDLLECQDTEHQEISNTALLGQMTMGVRLSNRLVEQSSRLEPPLKLEVTVPPPTSAVLVSYVLEKCGIGEIVATMSVRFEDGPADAREECWIDMQFEWTVVGGDVEDQASLELHPNVAGIGHFRSCSVLDRLFSESFDGATRSIFLSFSGGRFTNGSVDVVSEDELYESHALIQVPTTGNDDE